MNPEVQRLFEAALELPEGRREAFIASNCTSEVRGEVLSLLAHDAGAEEFFVGSLQSAAASLNKNFDLSPGAQIGAYRIVSLLGRGGMGAVYLADRADGGFDQRVAVKVIQSSNPAAFLLDRFQRERQILAHLSHPNVARLLDGGQTPTGIPYFVMEYVPGQPVDLYCEEGKLHIRSRLELFLKVCDAVQYAHQNLTVHRDLKPANILVTREGQPKLLDFGIAKVLDPAESENGHASTGVLTPEYASPEQMRGEPITTATDIYSLGAVLYRLLAGHSPHSLEALSPLEAVRTIAEQEVVSVAGLPSDVNAILLKALRKDAAVRYRSVEEFAADIRRYLDGQPVLAAPASFQYRAGKFMRRNRLAAIAVVAVVLALTGGTGAALWQARRADRRFAQVRKLANTFLFDFERSIRPLAGSTPSRQLVVKTALEYLESLSREARGDPDLTRELSAAYGQIADIQGDPAGANLGDSKGALSSYNHCVELLDSLGDGQSTNPTHIRNYVRSLSRLGTAQSWNGDLKAALTTSREASRLANEMLLSAPHDPLSLEIASRVFSALSYSQKKSSDMRGALDSAGRSVGLLREASAMTPSLDRVLAAELWNLGGIYDKLNQPGKAMDSYHESIAALEALAVREPENALHRRNLMIACSRLSSVLALIPNPTRAQRAEAVSQARRALDIAQAAAASDPANARGPIDLMATSNRFGVALLEAGRAREALDAFRASIRAADESVRRDPNDREALLNRAMCHTKVGDALSDTQDFRGALHERRLAEVGFDQLAATSPRDTRIRDAQVGNWLSLGETLLKLGDRAAALACIGQGLEVARTFADADPADYTFHNYLKLLREAAGIQEKSSIVR